MPAKQIIAANRLNKQPDGSYTITVNNPLTVQDGYLGLTVGFVLPASGTNANGPNCVLSIAPDGSPQARPQGTAGPWETAVVSGGIAVFSGTGQAFVFGCQEP